MKKWIIAAALIAGGGAGALGIANLIEILKPFATLITAGGVFLGIVANYFVVKANTKETPK